VIAESGSTFWECSPPAGFSPIMNLNLHKSQGVIGAKIFYLRAFHKAPRLGYSQKKGPRMS